MRGIPLRTHAIFTGSELLSGQTTNTNLRTLGVAWTELGWNLEASHTIPDELSLIQKCLQYSLQHCDIVIICGGLGPTSDDITRRAVASALSLKISYCEKTRTELEAYMDSRGRQASETWLHNQSEKIQGSNFLENSTGIAKGQIIKFGSKIIALLPGPPVEFIPMLKNELIPLINTKSSYSLLKYLVVEHTESAVEKACAKLVKENSQVNFSFCAQPGFVKLALQVPQNKDPLALAKQCVEIFGKHLITADSVQQDLIALLKNRHYTIATAESCTGGLISSTLTAVPGASEVLQGAIVSYACEWKNKHLGVNQDILNKHGAVSPECAEAMAIGLRDRFKVDCGIAVTGIAGPGGGSEEKPVGLVYISIFTPKYGTKTHKCNFKGNREMIRTRSLNFAMNHLIFELIKK